MVAAESDADEVSVVLAVLVTTVDVAQLVSFQLFSSFAIATLSQLGFDGFCF